MTPEEREAMQRVEAERDLWHEKLRSKISQLDDVMQERDAAITELARVRKAAEALSTDMERMEEKVDRAYAERDAAIAERDIRIAEDMTGNLAAIIAANRERDAALEREARLREAGNKLLPFLPQLGGSPQWSASEHARAVARFRAALAQEPKP
jgi:hypothetical protein